MSSTNNRKGVIVGLFVLIGVLIIIAGILTLGGQKKAFVKSIHIQAVFADVNGLSVGNNVWFSGVKIGTIKKVSFDKDARVVVQMSIEEKVSQYIGKDSKAKVSSDGFIGNKIVVLYGGAPGSPPVVENSILAVESAINPEEMLNTLQANNKNLLEITANFKVISDRIASGKGSVGKLLTDETLFNDLQTTMSSLKKTSANAGSISADLSGYVARFKQKGTLADDLVSDTVIFSRLRATVTQINEVAAKSNDIVEQLSHTASKINNTNTPVGALLNDEQAGSNLKVSLKNLESASGKLDENMEALQHNFLLRGFFRKKARQEKKEAEQKPQ
ncbi:MAG: MlaD family protein [Flavitalea sp.]